MATNLLETTVVDLVDIWAIRTPEATAVEWNGSKLTFAGLRNASLHVSKALLSVGVQAGAKVPILSKMSLELIPAIMGVLRVGACYVPIDMEVWSKTRIDATLEDISPQVAIATDRSDTRRVPVIVFFQEQWLHSSFNDEHYTLNQLDIIRQTLDKKALVYVTFTSGTTGKPKGVMIYHYALSIFATLRTEYTNNINPGERVLLGSCISFDACAATIWSTITKGGAVVMASWSTFPDVSMSCDTLILTPSMFATLDPAGPYHKVRTIILGSEAANFEVARRWITPTRRVIHTYGPSEATINIAYGEIPEGAEPDMGVLNPGVDVILVDENLQECDCGEILIGGPCVGAGYLNNPELTAKKFIDWNGKRVYRTGDLARRTKNGLSWVGRADRIVKNRGFLVNLETEVEAGILRFNGVRAASAFVWRGKLMGFVQPATVDLEELRVFMKENFDQFVIPDEIAALAQFPLTAHGKVDRAALYATLEERMAEEDAFLDALECNSPYDALRWAFAKCLHIPFKLLSRTSSFAQLGGNSLTAIHLSNVLRQQGYAIAILEILRKDTIDRLEEHARNTSEQNESPETIDDVQTESDAAPVTDMHRLMLTQSQHNPMINCQIARAKFVGPPGSTPTPSELQAAWKATLAAHSIFKTRYNLQTWTLHDLGYVNLDWEEVKVGAENFDNALLSVEEQVWARHRSLKNIPHFNLEVPYCHMTCVYAPSSKTIGFVWRVHHVLTDIFAGIILMYDLKRALAKENVPVGPRLQDYSRFMQRYKDKHLGTATEYWENMMKPLSEQSLFSFRTPQTSFEGNAWRSLPFSSGETVESVEASVRTYNISSATLIFAAWALVLANYTGSNLASFHLSRSGRMVSWPPASSLVAAMHCRVPFTMSISPEATVEEWLVETHKTLLCVAELENLCQSLDVSICPKEYFKTGVQAFLYMPQMPDSWEVHDRLTGQASSVGMVWRVQPTADGAVEAKLEIDQRVVDGEWAKEVGTVAMRTLEGLANAPKNARIREFRLDK